VTVQHRICSSVMDAICREDSLAKRNAQITVAEEKMEYIEAFLRHQSPPPPRLLALPDTLIFGHLSPLLGTQTIISRLSPTHPSLHSLATNPAMHTTVHFDGSERPGTDTDPDEQELSAWLPRLSKAKNAFVRWPVYEWAAKMVEAMRVTLESLDVDSYSIPEIPEDDGLCYCPRQGWQKGQGALIFPKLTKVKVGGWWIRVPCKRTWGLTAVQDLHIRDETFDGEDWHGRLAEAPFAASWKRWSPGPHHITLEHTSHDPDAPPSEPWALRHVVASEILSPSVKYLHGVKVAGSPIPGEPSPLISRPQVESLHATVVGENVTTSHIEELHWIRKHWTAPAPAVNLHTTGDLTFSTAVLAEPALLADMAILAPSLAALASVVTSVDLVFDSALVDTLEGYRGFCINVSLLFSSAVFDRATRLVGVDTHIDGLVSKLSHAFPSVTTFLLPMQDTTGESMAWAIDAVGMLRALETIEFTSGGSGRSSTSSVPECDSIGPCLHMMGVFSPSVCSLAFEEQTGQSDQREGLRERIRHITLEVDLSDDVHGEPWVYCGDVAGACLAAIHNFPCLDRIVLECREIVWPEGDRGGKEDSSSYIFDALHTTPCWYLRSVDALGRVRSRLFFLALHGLGWEAIELPPLGYDCRVEVRRIGAVDDPTQRRITDCFLPATRSDLSHM